ncbi:MAG: DUF4760 domain-containing protein [Gammaproteobacteria bacterium]
MAKQKETLVFLHDYNAAARMDDAFIVLHAGKNWEDMTEESRADIKYLLNFFENLAIGLNHNIYDRKMVRDAFGLDLWLFYQLACPYIRAVREEDKQKHPNAPGSYQRAYSEFEKLSERISAAR